MKLKYEASQTYTDSDSEREISIDEMNSYYLEMTDLLRRVESSENHYQSLGLDRSATLQQIKRAYQQVISLLFPPYSLSSGIPPDVISGMMRAFDKASRAYSVLALCPKRQEYDRSLPGRSRWPGHELNAKGSIAEHLANEGFAKEDVRSTVSRQKPLSSSVEALEARVIDRGINRRRAERIRMNLSVKVSGHDRKNGKWEEMAETIDVSRMGVTIRLRRKMRHGLVLYLTLALPDKLRSHGFGSPGYNVYALVRRVERAKGGVRIVGLEFLGEHPPAGYLESPWVTFKTKPWAGIDRRRKNRQSQEEAVSVEFFDEMAQSIARCVGKTENLGPTGVRLCVRQAPAEFELVRVTFTGRGSESFANLRNRYLGQDGFERLCLAFIGSDLAE